MITNGMWFYVLTFYQSGRLSSNSGFSPYSSFLAPLNFDMSSSIFILIGAIASSIFAWLSLYIRGAENTETQIRIRMVNPLIIRPTYVNKYIAEKWNVKTLVIIRTISISNYSIVITSYHLWFLNLPTANFRDSTKSSTRKTPLSFLSRVFTLVASRSVSSNTLSEEIVVSVSKYF